MAWRNSVSYLVETDIDPSLFQPIFLRQRNVLNLACWHAQILVHRPFLLNNFASLANLGSTRHRRTQHNSNLTDEHVQKCLEAAMNIVGKIDELSSKGQLYNTYWVCIHAAVHAIALLLTLMHSFPIISHSVLWSCCTSSPYNSATPHQRHTCLPSTQRQNAKHKSHPLQRLARLLRGTALCCRSFAQNYCGTTTTSWH